MGVSRATGPQLVQRALEPTGQQLKGKRESVRGRITYILTGILAAELLIGGIAIFSGESIWTSAQDFLRIAIPATGGLLGSAVGFYLGSYRD